MAERIEKLYFSINEVAEKFDVSTSTLRHWEREFSGLNPKRTNSGERKYTAKDIQRIEEIVKLRKESNLTVTGTKKYLQTKANKADDLEKIKNKMMAWRSFFVELRDSLS